MMYHKLIIQLLFIIALLTACAGEPKQDAKAADTEEQPAFAPCDVPKQARKIVAVNLDGQIDLVNGNALKIVLQKYYEANSIEELNVTSIKDHYFLTGKGSLNKGGTISFGIQIKGVCKEQLFFTKEAAFEQTATSEAGCDHCDLILHDEHEGAHSGEGDTDCCKHRVSEFQHHQEGGFSHLLFESTNH